MDYFIRCSEKTLQSNEDGFFLQFANQVAEVAGKEWTKKVFGKLKTDQERIKILFEYKPVAEIICETLSHVQEIYRKKSAAVSQSRRLAAAKMENDGEMQKALLLYCQSVLRAPDTGEEPGIDDGFSLALAYWSRYKLLVKLKHYSEAIRDIQLAMKEQLVDQYHAEAYANMAICYKALNDIGRAKICLALAEKMSQGNNDFIEKIKHKFDNQQHEEERNRLRHLPMIKGGDHSELPGASKKLTVKQESKKGRYVVAKESIKTAEVLAVEVPYAACLLPDFFGTHCHHCFDKLLSPVGCKDCCSVAFCKSGCRDAALSTYHKYECRYMDLLIGSGMSILSHTSLRMITQNGLRKCLDLYSNRNNEKIFQLCTNSEKRTPSDFLQRTIMSVFLLRILQKSGYFDEGCANEDVIPNSEELKVGEMLLYNLQMLQFNAHEIYETRHPIENQLKDAKTVYIGVAVYPSVAMFNHECYPSVLRYFSGKEIVIRASRPIEPGEVVSENYGPIFTRMNLTERQKSLLGRYWFQCQCLACTQNWPSLKNGLETVTKKLRCTTKNCTGVFNLPLKNEKIKCPSCTQQVDLSKRVAELELCEDLYRKAEVSYSNSEINTAIDLISKAVDIYHSISLPPHIETHLAQETLRTLFAEYGNVFEAQLV